MVAQAGRDPSLRSKVGAIKALLADFDPAFAFWAGSADSTERAVALYDQLSRGFEFGWEGQQGWRTAPYWLGRVEERAADASSAATAYEQFLNGWRSADPTLPLVVDARERLVRLRTAASAR